MAYYRERVFVETAAPLTADTADSGDTGDAGEPVD